MKVYYLYPKSIEKWMKKYSNFGQGVSWGSIVVAKNKTAARKTLNEMQSKHYADKNIWLDTRTTVCEEINPNEYDGSALILDELPWGISKV